MYLRVSVLCVCVYVRVVSVPVCAYVCACVCVFCPTVPLSHFVSQVYDGLYRSLVVSTLCTLGVHQVHVQEVRGTI